MKPLCQEYNSPVFVDKKFNTSQIEIKVRNRRNKGRTIKRGGRAKRQNKIRGDI